MAIPFTGALFGLGSPERESTGAVVFASVCVFFCCGISVPTSISYSMAYVLFDSDWNKCIFFKADLMVPCG